VPRSEIPWDQLAFQAVRVALELHREDTTRGRFRMHHGIILREAGGGYSFLEHMAHDLG
jgi:hypothetical protein